MTTFLYSFLTAGADRIAQLDPHGWTLTVVSVSVVFLALFILYLIYGLSGEIFMASDRKKAASKASEEADAEVQAAIALALHLYGNEEVHDVESGIITIAKPGDWANLSIKRKRV